MGLGALPVALYFYNILGGIFMMSLFTGTLYLPSAGELCMSQLDCLT